MADTVRSLADDFEEDGSNMEAAELLSETADLFEAIDDEIGELIIAWADEARSRKG